MAGQIVKNGTPGITIRSEKRSPRIMGMAWTPKNIGGLALWLRPDASAVTTVSGLVSAWRDQSGLADSNRNASQSTTTSRFTYVASSTSWNNQPILRGNGTSTFMTTGTWSVALPIGSTWILVGKTAGNAGIFIDGVDGTHRNYVDVATNHTVIDMYAGSFVNATADWSSPGAALFEFDGASSKLFFNDFVTAKGTGDAGSQTLAGLTIGSQWGVTNWWNGDIAEIIAVSGLLSDYDKICVKTYLNIRYGLNIL